MSKPKIIAIQPAVIPYLRMQLSRLHTTFSRHDVQAQIDAALNEEPDWTDFAGSRWTAGKLLVAWRAPFTKDRVEWLSWALAYCLHPARSEFTVICQFAAQLQRILLTGEGLDAFIDEQRAICAGVDPQSFCNRRCAGEPAWEAYNIVQAFDGGYLLQ